MYSIIVGGGRTGFEVASRLLKKGHEPVIVEENEDRVFELTKKLDCPVIHGSGSDSEDLKKAGGEKAEALAALAGDDEINLMACKIAKNFGIQRVVTRVNKSKHSKMFQDLGADAVISSISASAGLFEKAIAGAEIYGILTLGGNKAEVVEVTVADDSDLIGKTIEEAEIPELCTVAMITREDELIPPRGDTSFTEGDQVILVGKTKDAIQLSRSLRGVN